MQKHNLAPWQKHKTNTLYLSSNVFGLSVVARLVGGRSSREGRVEVYFGSLWGTVCNRGFTDAAAKVVCYMLGYG